MLSNFLSHSASVTTSIPRISRNMLKILKLAKVPPFVESALPLIPKDELNCVSVLMVLIALLALISIVLSKDDEDDVHFLCDFQDFNCAVDSVGCRPNKSEDDVLNGRTYALRELRAARREVRRFP